MRTPLPALFVMCALISPLSFAQDPDFTPQLQGLDPIHLTSKAPPQASADPQSASPYKNEACYADPSAALKSGTQSAIDSQQAADILKDAGVTGQDGLKDAALINKWLNENFKTSDGGGGTVGQTTVQDLLKSRDDTGLTGCHDWALMLSTLMRSAGHPAQMVDTAGTTWMAQSRKGQNQGYQGHAFVEAYINGSWTLLDSVSPRYMEGYDHTNPYIPMQVGDQKSYCAVFKGVDPDAYGVHSIKQLNDDMTSFAKAIDPSQLKANGEHAADLPDVGPPLPYMSDAVLTGPCKDPPSPPGESHHGIVMQFPRAGLDVNAEKSGQDYQAHLYPYRRVFSQEPAETMAYGTLPKTMSFPTLPKLRAYLHSLQPAP